MKYTDWHKGTRERVLDNTGILDDVYAITWQDELQLAMRLRSDKNNKVLVFRFREEESRRVYHELKKMFEGS